MYSLSYSCALALHGCSSYAPALLYLLISTSLFLSCPLYSWWPVLLSVSWSWWLVAWLVLRFWMRVKLCSIFFFVWLISLSVRFSKSFPNSEGWVMYKHIKITFLFQVIHQQTVKSNPSLGHCEPAPLIFFCHYSQIQVTKSKINKWYYIKLDSCAQETINKRKFNL